MYVKDIRAVKNDLRTKYKEYRQNLEPETQKALDADIQSRFLTLKQYAGQKVIYTYVSKDMEVDTFGIIRAALANKKRVAVPRCRTDEYDMDFYYINSFDDLEKGAFGVLEPKTDTAEMVTDFSEGLCVVPGLCFDAEGFRLGYGKGYYDRFLSRFKGPKVGLCYTGCMQWKLPHGRYDRPVDFLVTEKYIRTIAKK